MYIPRCNIRRLARQFASHSLNCRAREPLFGEPGGGEGTCAGSYTKGSMKQQLSGLLVLSALGLIAAKADAAPSVEALEALGKQVFFDEISVPARQSCASCHVAVNGFTAGSEQVNLGSVAVPGAQPHRIGNRKPPSAAYAASSPNLSGGFFGPDCASAPFGIFCIGGVFWDGRATGTAIGDEVFGGDPALASAYAAFLGPLADQALGPFANPVEQNVPVGNTALPGAEFVCNHVKDARYAPLFKLAWGAKPDCVHNADLEFKRIAVAISAFEHADEMNSFSSFRDIALADDADGKFPLDDFSAAENLGHDLFYNTVANGGAGCASCHNSGVPFLVFAPDGTLLQNPDARGEEPDQIYSDSSFHNIGLPPNPDAANFDPNDADVGLAGFTGVVGHEGDFRTPTLRNVDMRRNKHFTKAYMHNGYFKSLEQVVHFYNTATSKPVCSMSGASAAEAIANDCWPQPETPSVLPLTGLVGDLGLTPHEEAALVAYLKTLTDTEVVKAPKPYHPEH
jgi:cytochrome c peroxidase